MSLRTERERGAHLLRRFGLGASEAELDYYLQGGLDNAIERLLNYEDIKEAYDYDLIDLMALDQRVLNPQIAAAWWTLKLITTRRPLQEKMTVFWHNHFATSAEKVAAGDLMHNQIELLRGHATADFHTILSNVSKDPAMLFWLDNQFNVKGKPNENFAREVMELFTLGEGKGYTESDVKEAARAFTGWTVGGPAAQNDLPRRGGVFRFDDAKHDEGEKTVLGRTGALTGDDVIDVLCQRPRMSEFLVNKMWEWFVYPDPEPQMVNRFAEKFRKAGLNVKTLLGEIMRSDEFYSDKADRSIYKNPVDFVIPPLRQLGVGPILAKRVTDTVDFTPRDIGPVIVASAGMKQMGMQLLYPPDVSGWPHGAKWISSATMVARIGMADKLFGVSSGPGLNEFSAFNLFEKDPTPHGIAAKLVSIFDAPMPQNKLGELVSAAASASRGTLTEDNANKTADAVARLIFASPEFQFC
jgi:uncharacterized protein (DUF1800 family)